MKSGKNILVYQIGSLGDTLISIPAYRAVREHFGSDAQIRVLHNEPPDHRVAPQQVLDGTGLVDGYISFRQMGKLGQSDWRTFLSLWAKLIRIPFDAVVYVAPSNRSAAAIRRDRLFFQLCGSRRLIGFHICEPALASEARGKESPPSPLPHEARMRLDRLRADGLNAPDRQVFASPLLRPSKPSLEAARSWLAERRAYPNRELVAICPGAKQPANFWPQDRFIEIGRRLLAQRCYEPIVIGGPAEQEIGEKMISAWGDGVNAAGQFDVEGSAALLHECAFLIGLDTGTTHLAASVGIPCVALYGQKNPPGQWVPLGGAHRLLSAPPVSCAGCGLTVCSKEAHPCMRGISVEEVWAEIVALQPEREEQAATDAA